MKRFAIVVAALVALCAGSTAVASEKLAKEKNCLACHAVASKLVGPSYKDIAAKYAAEDVDRLVNSIRKGSKGAWGTIPMPPNTKLSEDDARKLATWILGLK